MTESADPVPLLLTTYLFADLTPAELAPLVKVVRRARFRRGEQVFAVGDPATHLYVVDSGRFKECVHSVDGDETITELLSPGAVFGEPGLFAPERDRVVSVVALEDSAVLMVEREPLVRFLLAHPPTMLRLLEGVVAQVRESVEVVAGLGSRRIRDRLAVKLAELAETHGVDHPAGRMIDLRLSQSTLAGLVAASRPNVNRALAELTDLGHVRSVEGRYVVTDVARLRAAVGAERRLRHRRNRRVRGA